MSNYTYYGDGSNLVPGTYYVNRYPGTFLGALERWNEKSVTKGQFPRHVPASRYKQAKPFEGFSSPLPNIDHKMYLGVLLCYPSCKKLSTSRTTL